MAGAVKITEDSALARPAGEAAGAKTGERGWGGRWAGRAGIKQGTSSKHLPILIGQRGTG